MSHQQAAVERLFTDFPRQGNVLRAILGAESKSRIHKSTKATLRTESVKFRAEHS